MSAVKNHHSLEGAKADFDKLLLILSSILKEERPKTNILSTKLGKLKKDIENIDSFDNESAAKIFEILAKYNSINSIFADRVIYRKKDLVKIIEGRSNYVEDGDEKYNDYFFELSMAARFLLATKDDVKINLGGICDIVVNKSIAIECKYIHSLSNLVSNIKKADDQIEKRVQDGQAKLGFIALDLSHVCPREKIKQFVDFTFERFVGNYKILKSKRRITGGIIEEILSDNNFSKIVGLYIMAEVEAALYGELGFSYAMNSNTNALIFQSLNTFFLECEGEVFPFVTRGMTYFLNGKISDKGRLWTEKFIHSLAVGI